jgi:2-dehydro-3-deoxyphosphogluconate aldolase / (4S)-4-hydroxy-2-oxoglutarate aldolase
VSPHPLLSVVEQQRAFAVIRTVSAAGALAASRACLAGGLGLIEVTLTVPDAFSVISELAQDPRAVVGAGSVFSRDDVRRAHAAGARFAVSPHFDADLVAEAGAAGLLCSQGGATPTELMACHRAGVDITKVFPAPSFGGPAHLRALRNPMPFLRLMPSGGVQLDDMLDYLDAGALAVGLTDALTDHATVSAGDWATIEQRARYAAARLAGWRASRVGVSA